MSDSVQYYNTLFFYVEHPSCFSGLGFFMYLVVWFLWVVFFFFFYSNKNSFKSLPSGVELELFYGHVN